jgi:hypothetical protein
MRPSRRRTVDVRLDPEVLARIEALRRALSTEWHEVTRAEALRIVIRTGIHEEEKRRSPRRWRAGR